MRFNRETVKTLLSGAIAVLLFFALVFTFFGGNPAIAVSVFLLLIAGLAVLTWKKGRPDWRLGYGVVLMLVYLSLFVITRQGYMVVFFLASLVLLFIYRHMENVDSSLHLLRSLDERDYPAKVLLSRNNKLIAVFIAALGGVAVLAVFIPFGAIFSGLAAVFAFVFTMLAYPFILLQEWLAPHLSPDPVIDPELPELELGFLGVYGDEMPYMPESPPPPPYAMIVFFALFTVVILWLVIRHFVYKKRRAAGDGDDYGTTRLKGAFFGDLLSFLPKPKRPRHPIRRAYARKVKKHIRSGTDILISDTTDIIAKKIEPKEDIGGLTAKYEKVRYGP